MFYKYVYEFMFKDGAHLHVEAISNLGEVDAHAKAFASLNTEQRDNFKTSILEYWAQVVVDKQGKEVK